MRKLIDWLFLSDQQYWEKYMMAARLGQSPYFDFDFVQNARYTKGPGFVKRMLIAVFS